MSVENKYIYNQTRICLFDTPSFGCYVSANSVGQCYSVPKIAVNSNMPLTVPSLERTTMRIM